MSTASYIAKVATSGMNPGDIFLLAKKYASLRAALAEEVGDTNRAIAVIKLQKFPRIKSAARRAAEAKALLLEAVRNNPQLFKRPKTAVYMGIRVGWRKAKGKVELADEPTTIKLIRRHLADIADTLIKVKERVLKAPLAKLSGAEVKKIGATLTETGDEPLVEPTDGEIEKLVDALLEDGAREAEEDE